MKRATRGGCYHRWARRSDADASIYILRFQCSKCGKWGHKRFGEPDSAIVAYSDQGSFRARENEHFELVRVERRDGANVGGFNARGGT